MNSLEIKHALLSYFRFKRQWICASECMDNDIMVITNKGTIEVEVKVNKYDLWKGEAKKSKHRIYKDFTNPYTQYHDRPNRFYICIPEELKDEAIKWVETINKKYGILLCKKRSYYPYSIYTLKRATILHNKLNESLKERIMKRVCTENINLIGRLLVENDNKKNKTT